jgi:polysaccharide export outer membrane protein
MEITRLEPAKIIRTTSLGIPHGTEAARSTYLFVTKSFRNKRLSRFFATLLLATAAPVFFTPPATASTPPATTNADYLLAPGDTIVVEVFGKPELTRTITIPTGGKVTYPFLGELQAVGVSTIDFGEVVRNGLTKELSNPQVIVTLVKRHVARAGILGPVAKPGKFDLEEGWRVLDLLAESGGLTTTRPEWVQATLVRGATGSTSLVDLVKLFSTGDLAENRLLEPGDVLVLREKDPTKTKIQVLGAVMKPGLVDAPSDGSVLTVLINAGGTVPRAKLTNAVIRRDGTTIPIDLTQINTDGTAKSADAPLPTLRPGDTLSIPMNNLIYSVLGEVVVPGAHEYLPEKNVTAVTALLSAGGASPNGDPKKASIIRLTAQGDPVILPVDLEAAVKSNAKPGVTNNIALQPGDVLYLPSRKQAQGNGTGLRDVLSLIPFAGLFFR